MTTSTGLAKPAAPDAPTMNRPNGQPAARNILITAGGIALVSLFLLLFNISVPSTEYWDEGIYTNIARQLRTHTLPPVPQDFSAASFGRQHPPLTTFLIAGGMKLAGDNPLGWRVASVVVSVLTIVAIFLWTWLLLRNYRLALTAAALTLLNNFFFVMGRIGMPDVFLFSFGIWGVLAFTAAILLDVSRGTRRLLMLGSGLCFGLAMACKWNAVDSWGAVVIIALVTATVWKLRPENHPGLERPAKNLKSIGLPTIALALGVLPLLTYFVLFVPLFRAMHTEFSLAAFFKLHLLMMKLTKAAPGNPAQYSPWYRWLFRFSPVRGLSYLMGNPAVMWSGVLAVVVCARRMWKQVSLAETMVVCLYACNLLQWVVTPIRVPNYYYYYPAAMLLAPAIAVGLNAAEPRRLFGIRLSFLVVLLALIIFVYCYPRMAYLESPWDCMFGCWV